MSREVPIKNLEDVHYAALSGKQTPDLCHVYGIFRKEERKGTSAIIWHLFDEFKEVGVYLCGKTEEYPRPKPGDVVRIHRLRIDSKMKRPEISIGRNVVYWPAFQYDPKPVATARDPTITPDDNKRRRVLETLFSSNITRCREIIRANDNEGYIWYQAVAGCVEDNQLDMFENHVVKFMDGTEPPIEQLKHRPTLRVFKPDKPEANDVHYSIAKTLKRGQYFVATNVKLARFHNLNLSANVQFGRSLRIVEEASILGVMLKESLEPSSTTSNSSQQKDVAQARRRSPRFLAQQQVGIENTDRTSDLPSSQATTATSANSTRSSTPLQSSTNTQSQQEERVPHFHRFSEIKPKDFGYDFYDLIGQVRDKPRLTKQFNNCVLQVYDGSRHNHTNFYNDEYEKVVDGCLVLYVYSKQAPHDTNEHFERAMSLKPGDIIYMRNVKVSSRGGRLRLELQANKLHNKSINVIDIDSPFGRRILDIVQTPQVEEILTDGNSDSSQEQQPTEHLIDRLID